MEASRGALRILNEELRVHRPRALQSFVTKLPGVACAMNAAFNAIAVLALIDIVVQAGRKIDEFVTKNQEAARKHQEAWRQIVNPMRVSNDELQVANDRLENSIAKLSDQDQRAP
jgi:predicted PurR-regulated permease PerM